MVSAQTGLDRVAALWLAELSDGRLAVQECSECGGLQHPPSNVCRRCKTATRVKWRVVAGEGHIEASTVVHSTPYPERAVDLPYVIARVRLAEGVSLIANLMRDECAAPTTAGSAVTLSTEHTILRGAPTFTVDCACGTPGVAL